VSDLALAVVRGRDRRSRRRGAARAPLRPLPARLRRGRYRRRSRPEAALRRPRRARVPAAPAGAARSAAGPVRARRPRARAAAAARGGGRRRPRVLLVRLQVARLLARELAAAGLVVSAGWRAGSTARRIAAPSSPAGQPSQCSAAGSIATTPPRTRSSRAHLRARLVVSEYAPGVEPRRGASRRETA
jgi:hypothetical protein